MRSVPFEVPSWIEPMAATLTRERFAGPDWIFERKLDGIRMLAFKRGDEVRLLSRNQLPLNDSYPGVVEAVRALPIPALVLDGEALGWFRQAEGLGYHVFDLLWLEQRDLRDLTLDARFALLQQLPLAAPLRCVIRLTDAEPWQRASAEGWEGVIAKRRDSRYESRRSPAWLKMKCEAGQELVVGGFTEPQGKRVGIGALLVGYYEGDDFVFAGKVGTGLDTALLLALRERFRALSQLSPPFTRGTGLPRTGAHWVRPELVVQVAFMEWTRHGKLRHPRLVGLREDKAARQVVRERP
jgi:bifunctional non-homologous end joining protein LigD